MSDGRFDVSIWFDAPDDPGGAAEALVKALGNSMSLPARARGVRATDHGVVVRFPEVDAKPLPGVGEQAAGGSESAADAVPEHMAEVQDVLPVLRALISLSAARVRAGTAPAQRVVIDVRPARVHSQDELRHS